MRKPSRPKLQGLIEPESHSHIVKQSPENAIAQLHDDDVPAVSPETAQEPEASSRRRGSGTNRTGAQAGGSEFKDYAHRSLYARPETLELIRQLAFKERKSAQALYREGLFLMLRARGLFEGKTEDDV